MGLFTGTNRVTGTTEALAEAVGYNGEIGATTALIENLQNDRALFEAAIESDFNEVQALREGADLVALNEASLQGMGSKIKEFLKKVWEKIKGLLNSFVTMLMNVVIRDNKKFVDKYRTEVLKKDLTKMEFKWSENKKNADVVFDNSFWGPLDFQKNMDKSLNSLFTTDKKMDAIVEKLSKVKSKEFKDDAIKNHGITDPEDPIKSLKESEYKDSDKIEGLSSNLLRNIMDTLTDSKDTIKAYNKAKTDADKVYAARLKEVDEALKTAVSGDQKAIDSDYKIKLLNLKHATISTEQEIVTKMISTVTAVVKWKIKECRAVFARAAAFNPKSIKESAELEDAMDDVQHGIVDDMFENEMYA